MNSTFFDLFNLFSKPKPSVDRPQVKIQQSESDASFESQIFYAVNQHRTTLEIPSLDLVAKIGEIARQHSQWMCSNEIWEGEACHFSAGDRATQVQKLGFGKVAENIATAQVSKYRYRTFDNRKLTANIILAHWIASAGHREAIEEQSYTHTGIGVISRELCDEDGDASRFIYVTQLFTN
jgi:uncharacterized protein YkwD